MIDWRGLIMKHIESTDELSRGMIILTGSTFYSVTHTFPRKFRGFVWSHADNAWGAERDVPLPSPTYPAHEVTERHLFPAVQPQSGYTTCTCRDCCDITMSGDMGKPELCGPCIDADCLRYSEEDLREGVPSYSYDCQREDAYSN